MNDMRAVIVPKSDQINADHLLAGPLTITITNVTIRPGTEQPVSVHYDGDDGKPYKPCKSMARVMVHAWGPDANAYIGRRMTLFCDPKVKWGGMAVGGIRISHMSHINGAQTMALTETKGKKTIFTVQPLVEQQPTPKEWLLKLKSDFERAPDRAAVDALKAAIQEDYDMAPPKAQEAIDRLVTAALARTAPADDFPGDVT